MTPALNLIASLLLVGCTAGAAPVTSGKVVKPAPVVQVAEDLPADEDDGPEIADEDIPIPDDFEATADQEISDDNLEAELKELEGEIGD